MESGIPQDLVAALVTLVVVGLGGGFAVLAARRARAARRRQIEAADEPRAVKPGRKELEVADLEGEPEAAEDNLRPPSGAGAEPVQAERMPSPEEAPGAQILPFPKPAAPAVRGPEPKELALPAKVDKVQKKDRPALSPGLAKTRAGWVARLGQIFSGRKELDPTLVDEMEKVLLTADIGVRTSQKLLEELRASLTKKELADSKAVWALLRRRCREILSVDAPAVDLSAAKPFVLLVIGVNGSGKTTTIGKLAAQFKGLDKAVLLAAGDTFRAAAAEQLEVWGDRVGVPVVRGKEGADPSSVIFEAVKRAKAENIDLVIADTAGRLHTKADLMQELQKVRRVVGKAQDGAPHETWLVIDATSGQNAIAQAQIFTQAMSVTGIVLTKLDGTAKGGVILGIADQLGIPVRYVGVGERVEDLRAFDPDEFVEALFEGDNSPASAA
jgi:fused signal recognition particle receptor